MKDLGEVLIGHKNHVLSRVFVHRIIVKPTLEDVILQCVVIHDGAQYKAVLALDYTEFNELLIRTPDSELKLEIACLMGEALSEDHAPKRESPYQINLLKIFGRSLRVRGSSFYTHLFMLPGNEHEEDPRPYYVFLVDRLHFARVRK
ncbi:MAG: hypothetical protein EA392_14425 [Cryomorphaceae bacterium]|nr:MAG: hypothetical protein EA392_14425 [Cryomorphaceae bacterium]